MAFNETFEKRIINGEEVMVCIHREEVPDPAPLEPTPEEKIKMLEEKLRVHAEAIAGLSLTVASHEATLSIKNHSCDSAVDVENKDKPMGV